MYLYLYIYIYTYIQKQKTWTIIPQRHIHVPLQLVEVVARSCVVIVIGFVSVEEDLSTNRQNTHGVMVVFPCIIVGPKPLLNIQSGCSYKFSPVCTSVLEKFDGSALYVHTRTPIGYLYCQSYRYTMPTEWHRFHGTTITNHLFGL